VEDRREGGRERGGRERKGERESERPRVRKRERFGLDKGRP